jgi:hypothetical protein
MHINKINNKKYVGITKQKPEKRWSNGNHYKSILNINRKSISNVCKGKQKTAGNFKWEYAS